MPRHADLNTRFFFPIEIWELILSHLDNAPPFMTDEGFQDAKASYLERRGPPPVRNLRLVSRAFNWLAGPYLCPLLRLDVSHESLERAEGLLRSPVVARGIRTVQVSLADHRADFQLSRVSFCSYWTHALGEALWQLEHGPAAPGVSGDSDEEDDGVDRAMVEVQAVLDEVNNYRWHKGYENSRSLYELVRSGHEQAKRNHEAQISLLRGGYFVRRLAAAMGALTATGHGLALHLTDAPLIPRYSLRQRPSRMFLRRKDCARVLAGPLSWAETVSCASLVRVLTELPIAISLAGGHLRGLWISCSSNDLFSVYPPSPGPSRLLRLLRDALGQLEWLVCDPPLGVAHWPCEALLSARLKHLNITGWYLRFGLGAGGRVREATLTRVHLSCGETTQGDMESLCMLLSPACERLCISDVNIKEGDGEWKGVFGVLRARVGARVASGRCEMRLSRLTEGHHGISFMVLVETDERGHLTKYGVAMKNAREYIMGRDVELTSMRWTAA